MLCSCAEILTVKGAEEDTYFPYETYGEAVVESVNLMSSQRERIVEAEKELLRNYGTDDDDKDLQKLFNLLLSTKLLINQTFNSLRIRLQAELKPSERYDPINDRTFAKLAHVWNEIRRYLEQRVEQVDDSALLMRMSNTAELEISKQYHFIKGHMKKLRDGGY